MDIVMEEINVFEHLFMTFNFPHYCNIHNSRNIQNILNKI